MPMRACRHQSALRPCSSSHLWRLPSGRSSTSSCAGFSTGFPTPPTTRDPFRFPSFKRKISMLKKAFLGAFIALTTIQPTYAADKVTVMLDWFLNPDHAPIIVAEQIGAFKEQGLDVEIVPPADPSTPPRLV